MFIHQWEPEKQKEEMKSLFDAKAFTSDLDDFSQFSEYFWNKMGLTK